jgi:fatty acid desaturase
LGSVDKLSTSYPIYPWRPLWDIGHCWFVIAAMIYLSFKVPILYPICLLVIANRYLALSLIGHEGLHGNLSPNKKLNDFLGRYFCSFPSMTSFSKYRRLHFIHHRALSHTKWDPDLHLYNFYPYTGWRFFWNLFFRTITLRTFLDFAVYYSEFPEFINLKKTISGKLWVTSKESDFPQFILFASIILSTVIYFGWFIPYLLFYVIPFVFIVQPYVLVMGGLQHGLIFDQKEVKDKSRTVVGHRWAMSALLPLNINYHAEHHLYPNVPHYQLSRLSQDLKVQAVNFNHDPYWPTLNRLFSSGKS